MIIIVIYSETWEEHLQHIRLTLQRLREGNLTAKPSKCQFGKKECIYLGHKIGNGEVKPDQEKISAVTSYPEPKTKKQVRGFLGLTGYYRKFIQNYAEKAAPLTDLTKKKLPDKVTWTKECERAFKTLKTALCQTPILRSPDFDKNFILQTDASDIGIGAVMSQLDEEGQDYPLAYYSRKLLPREQKYSTVEKECLAIKLAVEHFKIYLLGKPFTIHTDHRSLKWLNSFKDKNGRLTRWSLSLQPYVFDVMHKAGIKNGNADALSRISTDNVNDMSVAGEGGRSVKVQDQD